MGRSYWFECSKCGYRAKVSGRADRGLNCFVQTIVCRDCKELYDAVTRLRVPEPAADGAAEDGPSKQPSRLLRPRLTPDRPPEFTYALSYLLYTGSTRRRWVDFQLRCPVSATHRFESWNAPGKCPRCGLMLDKNTLPYRIWD